METPQVEMQMTPEHIIDQINAYRTYSGLKPLKVSKELMSAANERVKDIVKTGSFSHRLSTTSPLATWGTFIENSGYKGSDYTENLARGFQDATSTLEAWKKSDLHHANLIGSHLQDIGVGVIPYVVNGKTYYYVVQFGGGSSQKKKATLTTPAPAATSTATTAVKKIPTTEGFMISRKRQPVPTRTANSTPMIIYNRK